MNIVLEKAQNMLNVIGFSIKISLGMLESAQLIFLSKYHVGFPFRDSPFATGVFGVVCGHGDLPVVWTHEGKQRHEEEMGVQNRPSHDGHQKRTKLLESFIVTIPEEDRSPASCDVTGDYRRAELEKSMAYTIFSSGAEIVQAVVFWLALYERNREMCCVVYGKAYRYSGADRFDNPKLPPVHIHAAATRQGCDRDGEHRYHHNTNILRGNRQEN